jgi:hypothetical protein
MKVAKELSINIQEETLTEIMLIDLKTNIKKFGLKTKIVHCNKTTESRVGTDFLWFVGSNIKKSWVAFYVQAKKYSNDRYYLKHDYTSIKPKPPRGSGSKRQVDNLIIMQALRGGLKQFLFMDSIIF